MQCNAKILTFFIDLLTTHSSSLLSHKSESEPNKRKPNRLTDRPNLRTVQFGRRNASVCLASRTLFSPLDSQYTFNNRAQLLSSIKSSSVSSINIIICNGNRNSNNISSLLIFSTTSKPYHHDNNNVMMMTMMMINLNLTKKPSPLQCSSIAFPLPIAYYIPIAIPKHSLL